MTDSEKMGGIYSEAYDTGVWEWLKQHGTEETQQIIMMTASHFAKWQKEQMMARAIRGWVGVSDITNYHRLIYGCWDMNDALENCNEGDRVKVIIIKED